MTKEKISTSKKLNIPLLIFMLMAVLIGVLLVKWRNERIVSNISKQDLIATQTPYDFVKDGVYRNDKYRFSFKYPDTIFVSFLNIDRKVDYGSEIYEGAFADKEDQGYPDKYDMHVYVSDLNSIDNGTSVEAFEKEYYRPIGVPLYNSTEEKQQLSNSIKIKNLKNDKFIGFIQYNYDSPYADGIEPAASHSTQIKTGNLIIYISITSPLRENQDIYKNERLKILESIISSLELE